MAPPATEQKQRENGEREEEEEEEEEEEGEGEGESGGGGERVGVQVFMKNHSNSALLEVEPPVRKSLIMS